MGDSLLILYIYIYNVVYLFLVATGLRFFAWAFSSCSQRGLLLLWSTGLDTKA